MKYSYELLLKCNGLRFKAVIFNAPQEGVVRVEDGCVYLCYGAETYRPDRYNRRRVVKVAAEGGLTEGCIEHLEIVPRDPDTYTDFQVGDRLFAPSHPVMEVVFRSGEVVALKGLANGKVVGSGLRTCRELFEDGYRLVPTNIEEALENDSLRAAARERSLNERFDPSDGDLLWLRFGEGGGEWVIAFKELRDGNIYKRVAVEVNTNSVFVNDSLPLAPLKDVRGWHYASQEDRATFNAALARVGMKYDPQSRGVVALPEVHIREFRVGDPVLVRDGAQYTWKLRAFVGTLEDAEHPYRVTDGCFESKWRWCLPYDDSTRHLLGTSDNYEEEEQL